MNEFYKEIAQDMIAEAEYDALIPDDGLDSAVGILSDDELEDDSEVVHGSAEEDDLQC